jgi:3',5'-cyclic AMP phosphodiesterase CpdA
VDLSTLKFKEKGTDKIVSVKVEKVQLEDRMLMNDRYTYHYTAKMRNLKPGVTYYYQISPENKWSEDASFSAAAKDSSFSFMWFGDTHFSPKFGEILDQGIAAHPDISFFSIVGDLVSDGLNRNQWDALFEYSKKVACKKPFMSVPGNHDNRAGLGAQLYRDLFSYPMNAPADVPTEQTYSFTYKNALFLMIDATSPIDAQTAWIDRQLATTKAKWKIAMFHFPPFNWEEPYLDIQKAWGPVFDKYHVDMVLGGHIHYYMRSKPMKNGKVVSSYNDGTAYIISVAIPNREHEMTDEPYAVVRNTAGQLYQYVKIEGNKLTFESVNVNKKMIDSFSIVK